MQSLVSLLHFALPLSSLVSGLSPTASSSAVVSPHKGSGSTPRSRVAKNILESKPDVQGYCSLSGPIENTLCDYETLEAVNTHLYDDLNELVKTPFFRYYKVDLFRECPFWYENAFCMNRDCGVETADEADIPAKWRTAALSSITHTEEAAQHAAASSGTCYFREKDFCQLDDESQNEGEFVDLLLNPERFTGYAGASATRVWRSIYEENCFGLSEFSSAAEKIAQAAAESASPLSACSDPGLGFALGGGLNEEDGGRLDGSGDDQCLEKKIYYRVISGLHASISAHICSEYLDQETGLWAPSLDCFVNRIAIHPERLQNMYFNLVLLLRAVSRAAPYLSAYDVCSGDPIWDTAAMTGIQRVIAASSGAGRGPEKEVFDEGGLFNGENAVTLKEEFKDRFRNVSRIMDCVGCDKCRLWGKLQVSGLGTAMKILFELDESALDPEVNPGLLSRSEIVSLFNTLHRFSESLHSVETFRQLYANTLTTEADRLRDYHPPNTAQPKPAAAVLPKKERKQKYRLSRVVHKRLAKIAVRCKKGVVECLDACLGQGWRERAAAWLRSWRVGETDGASGGKSEL